MKAAIRSWPSGNQAEYPGTEDIAAPHEAARIWAVAPSTHLLPRLHVSISPNQTACCVEANYSWTSNTQTYTGFGADTKSHEISAAYVFRMPVKRWSPFVLAGAAL
jgi:hypothetical protein